MLNGLGETAASIAHINQQLRETPHDGRVVFADIASLFTVRGRREENQDRAFAALIRDSGGRSLFVACVADGMGGMRSGGEAAGLAVAAFFQAMTKTFEGSLPGKLTNAIEAANTAVWDRLSGDGGSTLTAVVVTEQAETLVVHVGDSRLYADDTSITQRTTDDTLAGLLGGDDADFFGTGLMQFVGMAESLLHQTFILPQPHPAALLLTTDGFHGLPWSTAREMFDPSEESFHRLSKSGGLDDNATAIIIDVDRAAAAAAKFAGDEPMVTSTGSARRGRHQKSQREGARAMTFARKFGQGSDDLKKFADTEWGTHLLQLWRPPGQGSGRDGLRLAIRNRSLNFYRRGQAVAKVSFSRRDPQMDIHVYYVTGKAGEGQHYARLLKTELSCPKYAGVLPAYGGLPTLRDWIGKAEGRAGDEKKFVDDLVTHNPGVIDLEMGLPAYRDHETLDLTAPRMDLVALEQGVDGVQIVFWEAKMMTNGELRCTPGEASEPHVVGQLGKYTAWLSRGTNRSDVETAYRENCRILGDLHALAKARNSDIGPLDPIIARAASGEKLIVDGTPRVIICEKVKNSSWSANGHDLVLKQKHGVQFQVVPVDADAAAHRLEGRQ